MIADSPKPSSAKAADKHGLKNSPQLIAKNCKRTHCPVCFKLNTAHQICCINCHARLHSRKQQSLQYTIAFLITGLLLYIPANLLPIMHTTTLGSKSANTILEGVMIFWQQGSYPIALIIFVASVLVPIGKMLALAWLCIGVAYSRFNAHQKHLVLYRVTEFIGRWSMVDVFVVAILVALIQIGSLMTIVPGAAALAFAGMVISTMIAAHTFDPRLIWDQAEDEIAID